MQNKSYKNRSWFENKKCAVCKKQGTTFRYINQKHQHIICDNPKCELMIRVRAGLFGGIKINKGA